MTGRGASTHEQLGRVVETQTLVPAAAVPLRNDALALLRGRSGRDRLPLRWGMCLATYPFFRDVATTTGRPLALQGRAALPQIVRRMAESLGGERSTLTRAGQRVVRSFADWGVLAESGDRGVFWPAARFVASRDGVGPSLVEADLVGCGCREYPLRRLVDGVSTRSIWRCPSERSVVARDWSSAGRGSTRTSWFSRR